MIIAGPGVIRPGLVFLSEIISRRGLRGLRDVKRYFEDTEGVEGREGVEGK